MQSTPTPPQSPPSSPEEDDAYYRAVLHDLIDRGADIARQLHERAAKHPESDLSIPFDRIARTIRRTIALARHIATNPPKTARAAVERTLAREKIIRGVEDAIEAKRGPATDTGILYNELHERLDDADFERDLRTRPIDDIIEELARDLGVAYQSRAYIWKRRTPADIATLRARAAQGANGMTANGTPPEPQNSNRMSFSPPQQRNKRWAKAP